VNGAKKTKVHGREMHFEVGRLGANLYNICICGDSRARLPCSIRSFGNSGLGFKTFSSEVTGCHSPAGSLKMYSRDFSRK